MARKLAENGLPDVRDLKATSVRLPNVVEPYRVLWDFNVANTRYGTNVRRLALLRQGIDRRKQNQLQKGKPGLMKTSEKKYADRAANVETAKETLIQALLHLRKIASDVGEDFFVVIGRQLRELPRTCDSAFYRKEHPAIVVRGMTKARTIVKMVIDLNLTNAGISGTSQN